MAGWDQPKKIARVNATAARMIVQAPAPMTTALKIPRAGPTWKGSSVDYHPRGAFRFL
jgi:hypothetical protein